MNTFETACRYVDAGLNVVPLRLDGSKGPALDGWKKYQKQLATCRELHSWFAYPKGIGLITGEISNGLEAIDFDMACLVWALLAMLPEELANRLSLYQTPSGWHLFYRCTEVCGNKRLACWEAPQSPSQKDHGHREATGFESIGKGVRIETRGEGGYVVAAGSPLGVHPSRKPYRHHCGPSLFEVRTITPDERRLIWKAAMEFDCGIDHFAEARKRGIGEARKMHYSKQSVDTNAPWDWFDRFGTWDEVLQGWTRVSMNRFRRPGKDHGISASIIESDGIELCTVFSTSADIQPGTYGKFNLLAKLRFNNDRREAAKHVRQMMKGGVAC